MHELETPPENFSGKTLRWLRLALPLLLLGLPALGGILTLIEVIRDGSEGVEGLGGIADVTATGDGLNVYSVGSNDHALSVFRWDATADDLVFVGVYEDEVDGVFGLLGASAVAASPDGRHVFATGEFDDSLVLFARDASADSLAFDATTDGLTFIPSEVQANNVGSVIGLDGPTDVVVSGDNALVFVTGGVDDALAVFTRDATSDDITFVEAEFNNVGGVSGLDGASAVAVSPDNEHVYVAGEISDSVAVFQRNGNYVDFVASYADGQGGIDGLNGACGVAVSPDGLFVYVVGRADDAVAIFSRNSTTGHLSYVGQVKNGVGPVTGLGGANDMVILPDGDRVFVSSEDDDSIVVFRRHLPSGTLQFLQVIQDGVDGVDGLAGVAALTTSADGENLFSAGRGEDSLDHFAVGPCVGDTATGDSDGDGVCDDQDFCFGDDTTNDTDGDGVCDDADCDSDDPSVGLFDACGICGGDGSTCELFEDGFESGDVSFWSSSNP